MPIVSAAVGADDFVLALIKAHPELMPVVDEHLKENDELLSHCFMADVVRFLEATYRDAGSHLANIDLIKAVMTTIGEHFANASPFVEELIAVSFVENMPYPKEDAAAIVAMLPDNLKAVLVIQREVEEGK